MSNKQAEQFIKEGKISINGNQIFENEILDKFSEVKVESKIIRKGIALQYYLLHKPRGIECTLNPEIPFNLLPFIPENLQLFYVGRLDKDSEGLLLMTNDGKLYKEIVEGKAEKEYEVETDLPLSSDFKNKMEAGIMLDGKLTEPCKVEILGEKKFRIILTEGKYRQIRRMSHKLGFVVTQLIRTRIAHWTLGNIPVGVAEKTTRYQ